MRTPTGRRDLIVTEALNSFTAHGYERTSIGDLASALDISKAAIAYYFPTKDQFLAEFVGPFLDDLDAATRYEPGDESIRLLGGYLDAVTRHHRIAVWVDTDPVIQNHPDYGGRLREINARAIRQLTGGGDDSAGRARALGALGGIWRPARELTEDELRQHRDEIVSAALASL